MIFLGASLQAEAMLCHKAQSRIRMSVLDQLQTFAEGTVPDLRDPVQATLFHLYRLRYMGDPTTQLHADTTAQIAKYLEAHPELSKVRFQSVSVDLAAPLAIPETVSKMIQQTKQSSVMSFGKIINIEANSGLWNKIFENIPAPAAEEKKGFFGSLTQTMVDKSKQVLGTRWKEFMPETLLKEISSPEMSSQQKSIILFQHLQSLRTEAIAKIGPDAPALKALSQVMADLIQTMPFSQKETAEMLKSEDGSISIQVFDALLGQRDSLSKELGYENYSQLLTSLGIKQPAALSLPHDKFMATWTAMKTEALSKMNKQLSDTSFTVRQLSLAESIFRSCLGGNECSSRTYPLKAADPNYHYFTTTDANFHSDANVTVVLGTGQVNGTEKKIAFIDKMQNVPPERVAVMIEGVRKSLAQDGYLLAAAKETVDNHTGMSNSPSTRAFFARFVGLEDSQAVSGYRPHPHKYQTPNKFSRAEDQTLQIYVLSPIETQSFSLQLRETPAFRPNPSSAIDVNKMARASYDLKNGDDRAKVEYVKTQDILKSLNLRDPQYSEIANQWLSSPEISFAIKKQIILTAEPDQIISLAETKLSETEKPRFLTAIVSSPFYRNLVGVENIYQFLESHPDYMKQISSEGLAGFSLQKILRLELIDLFNAAVEAPNAKINQQSKKTGNTAAHVVAKSGNIEHMRKLVAKGANLGATNHEGRTPLMRALIAKNNEMSLFILEQAGELNLNHTDAEGHTALYYAIKYGQTAAIYPLLRKGASPEFRDLYDVVQSNALFEAIRREEAETLKAVLAAQVLDIDAPDIKGFTPLMRAAMQNKEELVRILIAAGASKTATTPNGNTAADLAQKRGHTAIAQLLL